MTVRTYNVAIGFPACFKGLRGACEPKYSGHAKEQAREDRHGPFTLPKRIDLEKAKAVEVTYEHGLLTKVVLRVDYDARRDLVIVLRSSGVVPTVWGNLKSDIHKTLDRSKFTSPEVAP